MACLSAGSSREGLIANEPLMQGLASAEPDSSVVLPSWDEITPIAELYLLYCDSQPLPLFHRESFLASLQTRDVEIIYAILALGIRFSDTHRDTCDLTELVNGYAEVARGLVMKRVSEGPVEVSTLQCLCLLSLVDFTSKQTTNFSTPRLIKSNRWQYASLQHP